MSNGPEARLVEDPTIRWALREGIHHRKMNGMGNRGWPDQLFYSKFFKPGVKGVFIEFKAPGKEPTDLQFKTMYELQCAGFDVAWFDNAPDAIRYLNSFLNK